MKGKNLLQLFISTFVLSAFTFGGGYVIVSLMKKKFCDELKWIDEEEMLDLIAIAQSSPGAIAVNGAIVLGYKLFGLLGVIVAVLATILPPFIIISVISLCYELVKDNMIVSLMLEGMQAGVGAVICSVVLQMGIPIIKEKNILYNLVMIGAFVLNYMLKVNVIYIILGCGLIGVIYTLKNRGEANGIS